MSNTELACLKGFFENNFLIRFQKLTSYFLMFFFVPWTILPSLSKRMVLSTVCAVHDYLLLNSLVVRDHCLWFLLWKVWIYSNALRLVSYFQSFTIFHDFLLEFLTVHLNDLLIYSEDPVLHTLCSSSDSALWLQSTQ